MRFEAWLGAGVRGRPVILVGKSVYFYVGLPKTGTTTVQQYLRDNDAQLLAAGYLYPGADEHPSLGGSRNHILMMHAMTERPPLPLGVPNVEESRSAVRRIFRNFRRSPDLRGLIWSQEAMAIAAPSWKSWFLTALTKDLDVTIVVVVRFTDDWIESLYREMVWARAGDTPDHVHSRPLRPISGVRRARDGDESRRSALEHGTSIRRVIGAMRYKLPAAKIRLISFDEAVRSGRLVSSALEAFDLKLEGFFGQADADAGLRNPTKSTAFTMLLYWLVVSGLGREHVQSVGRALRRRIWLRQKPEWLADRRLRFLPAEGVLEARANYERLRSEFGQLPVQPPYVEPASNHFLSLEECARLLEWLMPDLNQEVYLAARAALAVSTSVSAAA